MLFLNHMLHVKIVDWAWKLGNNMKLAGYLMSCVSTQTLKDFPKSSPRRSTPVCCSLRAR